MRCHVVFRSNRTRLIFEIGGHMYQAFQALIDRPFRIIWAGNGECPLILMAMIDANIPHRRQGTLCGFSFALLLCVPGVLARDQEWVARAYRQRIQRIISREDAKTAKTKRTLHVPKRQSWTARGARLRTW